MDLWVTVLEGSSVPQTHTYGRKELTPGSCPLTTLDVP